MMVLVADLSRKECWWMWRNLGGGEVGVFVDVVGGFVVVVVADLADDDDEGGGGTGVVDDDFPLS